MPGVSLTFFDWSVIAISLLLFLLIGILASRQAGKSTSEFFLSGRSMPWWMLGVSMVATTFSADTPNLVADIVRKNGVSGNWQWWAFLLTGMLTVFVYAKLWRRSGLLTDLEFYELRYSGMEARFLRGFRAIYLGFFFNAVIMATVMLAGIKIGGALLGMTPVQTVVLASVITVIYSAAGGLRGVVLTDILQFALAMTGAIGAAIVVVNMPEIGGVEQLISHPQVAGKISLLPDFTDRSTLISLLIIPLAVQWWSAWYPGAEPGGGGYIAQRILAARNEKDAMSATLLFNLAHYALRPWPWIIVALGSLVIFPNVPDVSAPGGSLAAEGLAPLRDAFPNLPADKIGHDLAYPAMLRYLPSGLLGVVLVSLMAAFMSTISTHLNWGSSYLINDFYKAFLHPDASEKRLVFMGRISTVLLMLVSIFLAFYMESALDAFNIMLQIGAGTGLIYILRWFWYRINAWGEITAMAVSFSIALFFEFTDPDIATHYQYVIGVGLTTVSWVAVTLLTPTSGMDTLFNFYQKIRPHKAGWKPVLSRARKEGKSWQEKPGNSFGFELAAMFVAVFGVYAMLFATGYYIYGEWVSAVIATFVALGCIILLASWWGKLKFQ